MHILSVNVGSRRQITVKSRTVETGIYKLPVDGPVAVGRDGLLGDVLIEERKMGREHSAVYAYPVEHYAYWQRELERSEPFPIGQFGENLTVSGLLEETVRIGDVFRFGSCVLQVAHPRIPCHKLNERMGLRFAPTFLASRKVGYYFRVLQEGTVAPGDRIELLERDEASPTMEEFVRVAHYEYWDVEALEKLLQARDLVPAWKASIESKLQHARAAQEAGGWHGLRELEVLRREPAGAESVSLYLRCAKRKPLPMFRGGQSLMLVSRLPGKADQQRQAVYLSGHPRQTDCYRVTLRHKTDDATATEPTMPAPLATLRVGERIHCHAAHGPARLPPEPINCDRIPVLVCKGMGVAPMLSLLYEIEAEQRGKAMLFHEPVAVEAATLLAEVDALVKRNDGFRRLQPDRGKPIEGSWLAQHVPLSQSNIHVAGPRKFVDRLINELMALDISPAAVITHPVDH